MRFGNHVLLSPPKINFHSLRAKVTFVVLLPLAVILGIFMFFQFRTEQQDMINSLVVLASQTSLTIVNSLQKAMLTHNQEELQQILDSIGQSKMLQRVYILDTSGKVVFSPSGKGNGTSLDNHDANCQPCHHLPPAQRPSSVVITLADGQRVFRSMNPIPNQLACHGCHDPATRLNGVLLTDISMAPLEGPLRREMRLDFLWWVAAIVVSIIMVNIALDRLVLRRVETLSSAIHKLGLGQPSSLITENQGDEIGQVSQAFNEMSNKVEAREHEIILLSEGLHQQNIERRELLKRAVTAQEEERKRVARELHDELGQALAVLALQTGAASHLISSKPAQAEKVLSQTQALINETSERMYDLILALRPSALDDLGLVVAIRAHAERLFSNTAIGFELNSIGMSERLPPDLETGLYRIFQEALSNVIRHARANKVVINFCREDSFFVGEVRDDGQGFDTGSVHPGIDSSHGLGLRGMQERVMQLNGTLQVISQPGKGTCIRMQIPFMEGENG